ncbi:MAG: hypothetical protein L0Y68_07610 [Candidatus Dadabacteria bacterium]|nr:hypothetical protein [Candidatus Dadabacteria bacterium]
MGKRYNANSRRNLNAGNAYMRSRFFVAPSLTLRASAQNDSIVGNAYMRSLHSLRDWKVPPIEGLSLLE